MSVDTLSMPVYEGVMGVRHQQNGFSPFTIKKWCFIPSNLEGFMQKETPQYSLEFGRKHVSASGGTQSTDEHILKLYLRKQHGVDFPMSSRPRAGQAVQAICDMHFGLDNYSPINGPKQGLPVADAIRKGRMEYALFSPLDWDNGKDAEAKEEFIEHLEQMSLHAIDGIKEYFGSQDIEGEYQRFYIEERIDVPVTMFLDYASDTLELDLKCSFPLRNPPKKDGTRTWRVPKPRTEPTESQLAQQAVYWKATGLRPGLLFVTSDGYHLATEDNTPSLKPEALEEAYNAIVQRWLVVQNLMKAANGNWKTLFSMVAPDFGQISGRHGPEILNIAKQMWSVK